MKKKSSTPISLETLTEALNKRDSYLVSVIKTEVNDLGMKIEHGVEKRLTEFSEKMYTRIDPLLREIVDSREDRALASDEAEEFKRKLANHEKRIIKLEEN